MKKYRDYYFLKAKQENYPARSIYKLKEIHKRFNIFRPGMKVMDLGAAPGSWSLGAAEYIGESGLVLGLDIQSTTTGFPRQITFIQTDVFDPNEEFQNAMNRYAPFDVVMSDMAPNTTGHKSTDQARSAALIIEAFNVAQKCLKTGGSFIVKFFMGPDVQAFAQDLKKNFLTVKSFKPNSSRSESVESFYVAKGFNIKKQDTPK